MARQYWKAGNMVYPVPAVMVSCGNKDEKPNIITVAWSGTICTNPAMLYISVRPERYSYSIITRTKEFVVNLVTEDLVYALDYCGVKSGRDVDKFRDLKLTPLESKCVSCPSILESPVSIECELVEVKPLGSHHMLIAKVLCVSIDEKYMDETNRFNLNDSKLIAYSHGQYMSLGKELGRFGYSVRKKK